MTTEDTDARAAREDEAQIGTRRDGEETEVLVMKENHEDTEIEQAGRMEFKDIPGARVLFYRS